MRFYDRTCKLFECINAERMEGTTGLEPGGLCRDSRTQNRNLLKFNGTDGTLKRFWSSEITLLDRSWIGHIKTTE